MALILQTSYTEMVPPAIAKAFDTLLLMLNVPIPAAGSIPFIALDGFNVGFARDGAVA